MDQAKPAKPKKRETRMTSVNLPPEYHLPAPEMVSKIERWLEKTDIKELSINAAKRTLMIAEKTGVYWPVAFRVDLAGLQYVFKANSRGDANHGDQEFLKSMKWSFRIPLTTNRRLDNAARLLSTNRSEIIRMALIRAFPQDGAELLDLNKDFPRFGIVSRDMSHKE